MFDTFETDMPTADIHYTLYRRSNHNILSECILLYLNSLRIQLYKNALRILILAYVILYLYLIFHVLIINVFENTNRVNDMGENKMLAFFLVDTAKYKYSFSIYLLGTLKTF